MTISIVPITRDNWRATLEVRVAPEELRWVSSREPVALMLLAKSYVRPDGQVWHPFAVAAEGVVGIVGVGVDERDAQTAWVHHLLIDVEAQGRGHGRAAMLAIGSWLRERHPTVRLIGLNVLPDNERAMRMYRSLGFEPVATTLDDQVITMARVSDLRAE